MSLPAATASQLEALRAMLQLKGVKRTGWTRYLAPEEVESVADHSFGVALVAWLLCPDGLDRHRVLELALVHDLAEVVTGDRTPQQSPCQQAKDEEEARALASLTAAFPSSQALELLKEYQAGESGEARWVRAADKLEMTLQSRNYEAEHSVNLGEFRRSSEARLRPFGLAHATEG